MSDELISLFYAAADAVLANSGHEPFGLVGLEVMAAGGIVFVGSTGEDYAVPFLNSVVLDTDDPFEIGIALDFLGDHPEVAARIREDAQETARGFSWENVIQDNLIGKLEYVSRRQLVEPPVEPPLPPTFQGKGPDSTCSDGAAAGGRGTTASPNLLPVDAAAGGPVPRAPAPANATAASLTDPASANPDPADTVSRDQGQSAAYGGGFVGHGLSIKPRRPVMEHGPSGRAAPEPSLPDETPPAATKRSGRRKPPLSGS